MKYKLTTYKTISGTKEIIELLEKTNSKWIVYRNNVPAYLVDIFDLKTESNVIMNSLVLSARKSIDDVLKRISNKNGVTLSVSKTPKLSYKLESKIVDLNLDPLPESWISYSL